MYKGYWSLPDDHPGFKDGEVDWTTAVALYKPFDGQRREGWGRLPGSVGWGGAAGTEYWIDPESGIAVSSRQEELELIKGGLYDSDVTGSMPSDRQRQKGNRKGRIRDHRLVP